MNTDFEILVAGGGLVGLTAGIALSRAGLKTAVIDSKTIAPNGDPRASTLAASSHAMMMHFGLGEALAPHLQVINDMMIGEGRPGAISPLTLHFDGKARTSPMAYMIENDALKTVLVEAAGEADNLTLIPNSPITHFETEASHAQMILKDGRSLTAPLAIAADGRNSFLRRAASIACDVTYYDQSAIVTTVSHERPHGGVAQQLFLPGGPFAILPLVGPNRDGTHSSIVWSDKTAAVDAAMSLSGSSFHAELARRFGDHLGEISIVGPKLAYPLKLQMAESYTGRRLALIGDAAHAVHPLAGQGLNMGLRDAAAMTDVTSRAHSTGLDIGGAELEHYAQWRRGDNRLLAAATDGLNRLFSNSAAPLRHARRLGLAAVDSLPLAGRIFMAEAAGEMGELPSLLRA